MSIKANSFWNLLGSLAPLLVGALTIPFIIDGIGVELFGVLTIIWVLIGYFSLFDFGLGRALTQIIAKNMSTNNMAYLSDVASIGLILICGLGVFGGAVLGIAAMPLGMSWLKVSVIYQSQVTAALFIAAFGIPFATITSGLKGILEAYLDFKRVNYLRTFLGVANFCFPAISVYFFGASLTYVAVSLVFARVLVFVFHWVIVSKTIQLRFVNVRAAQYKRILTEFLSFGSWMTLSNILSPLMVSADRFVISSMVGASLVAYYTVPFEVVIRLLVIPAALTSAFFPLVSSLIVEDKEKAKQLFNRCVAVVASVMFAICITTAIFSKMGLSIWLNEDFAEKSWYIASILSIGIMFNGVAQIPHATIQAVGNVKATSVIHLLEFIIYIPTLVLTVYFFGVLGAVVVWVARAAVDMLLMFMLARRVFI